MTDYNAIYATMESGRDYTAKDLGVAPASMTAMVRRGLVRVTYTGSPKRYQKLASTLPTIHAILDAHLPAGKEFFAIHKANEKYGMLCSRKNGNILDCYGNSYNLDNVVSVEINDTVYAVS